MGQIKGLILKAADRPELERWARARNLPYRQVQRARMQRARMLRALAEGQAVAVVATAVGVVEATVATWRDRYLAGGLSGLRDQPRQGCPPTYQEADRVAMWQKLQEAPAGRPYAVEPDGAGHRPCAVSAATVVVGHTDPTPAHAYFQAVAGLRV